MEIGAPSHDPIQPPLKVWVVVGEPGMSKNHGSEGSIDEKKLDLLQVFGQRTGDSSDAGELVAIDDIGH